MPKQQQSANRGHRQRFNDRPKPKADDFGRGLIIKNSERRNHALPSWPQWNWDDADSNLLDRERIRRNTQKYADMNVTEAFAMEYPGEVSYIPAPEGQVWVADLIPADLRPGDRVRAKIKAIAKDRTSLEIINYKGEVKSTMNLGQWPAFSDGSRLGEVIQVQVTEIKDGKVTVDPLAPIFEDWINSRLSLFGQRTWRGPGYPFYADVQIVRDLHQVSLAGFVGKTNIRCLEEFLGAPYEMDVFIPSSHMILNICQDMSVFEGTTQSCFILNYSAPTRFRPASLVCSRKDYLRYCGDCVMVEMFGEYCENSQLWKNTKATDYEGMVTGIINSSKKCGVFVEVPSLCMTGMVYLPADQIVNYKPFDQVKVHIKEFEEDTVWNGFADQVQHRAPYTIEDGLLKEVTIKPVLEIAQ